MPLEFPLSAELEAAILLSRPVFGDWEFQKVQNLLARPDWSWLRLEQIVIFHGIASFTFSRLQQIFPDQLPGSELSGLRKYVSQSTLRHAALLSEFLKLQSLLAAADLPVAFFKGPVLSQLAYGDPFSRDFGDLDVFAFPQDIKRTWEVLGNNGFVLAESANLPAIDLLLRLNYEIHLENRFGLTVDLHWKVQPQLSQCTDIVVREHLNSVELWGRTISTFDAEFHFIVVCLHAAKGCWKRLLWISDVAHFVAGDQLDWIKVESLADQLGARQTVCLALLLAQQLMHVSLPSEFRDIEGKSANFINERVLALEILSETEGRTRLKVWKINAHSQVGAWSKMTLLFHGLVKPDLEDWQRIPLPAQCFWIYYPLHFFSELAAAGQKLWRILKPGGSNGQ